MISNFKSFMKCSLFKYSHDIDFFMNYLTNTKMFSKSIIIVNTSQNNIGL